MRYTIFAAFMVALAVQDTAAFSFVQFQVETLNSHNYYRELHRVPALRLSADIVAVAQEWAYTLAFEDTTFHRPNSRYGESIYWVSDRVPNGAEATDSFYNEINAYDFNDAQFSNDTEHFTQLVWRQTTELGVGVAQSRTGIAYVVANYYPPGNSFGQFEENVPRPSY